MKEDGHQSLAEVGEDEGSDADEASWLTLCVFWHNVGPKWKLFKADVHHEIQESRRRADHRAAAISFPSESPKDHDDLRLLKTK